MAKKYPPFVVMKNTPATTPGRNNENVAERHGFGQHVWKEIKKIQTELGVQVYGNAAAWWNSQLTLRFLEHNFGNRKDKGEPVLLLLDDFAGHWTSEVREYAASINLHLLKVPPRFTSVCQPADVAWNRPFKSHLRNLWTEDLAEQVLSHVGNLSTFKLKVADRFKISSWIVESWGLVSSDVIRNGFTKSDMHSEPLNDVPRALMVALLQSASVVDTVHSDQDMSDDEEHSE